MFGRKKKDREFRAHLASFCTGDFRPLTHSQVSDLRQECKKALDSTIATHDYKKHLIPHTDDRSALRQTLNSTGMSVDAHRLPDDCIDVLFALAQAKIRVQLFGPLSQGSLKLDPDAPLPHAPVQGPAGNGKKAQPEAAPGPAHDPLRHPGGVDRQFARESVGPAAPPVSHRPPEVEPRHRFHFLGPAPTQKSARDPGTP